MYTIESFNDVSVCVVGAGAIGSMHVDNLLKLGVQKVFVVEVDKAKSRLPQIGVEYKSDISELSGKGLDLAIIAVPTSLHSEIIGRLIKTYPRIRILCEKPLSFDLVSTQEILQSVPDIKVGFVERFHRPFEKLVAWHGECSARTDMKISRRTHKPKNGHWMLDKNQPGSDILLDLGIHDIDFLMQMKKELPIKISNHTIEPIKESFVLHFSDSSCALLESGWDLDENSPLGIENVINLRSNNSKAKYTSRNEELDIDGEVMTLKPRFMYSYTQELMDLLTKKSSESKFPSKEEIVLTMQCVELVRKDRNE